MNPPDKYRGTGRTTRQIQALPVGGSFIWCTTDVKTCKLIAERAGRPDVEILPFSVLQRGGEKLKGRNFAGIDVDHEAYNHMTGDEFSAFISARDRARR